MGDQAVPERREPHGPEECAHAFSGRVLGVHRVVQWADLMICKTRWLSIRQQGMENPAMNFGLCSRPFWDPSCATLPVSVRLLARARCVLRTVPWHAFHV